MQTLRVRLPLSGVAFCEALELSPETFARCWSETALFETTVAFSTQKSQQTADAAKLLELGGRFSVFSKRAAFLRSAQNLDEDLDSVCAAGAFYDSRGEVVPCFVALFRSRRTGLEFDARLSVRCESVSLRISTTVALLQTLVSEQRLLDLATSISDREASVGRS